MNTGTNMNMNISSTTSVDTFDEEPEAVQPVPNQVSQMDDGEEGGEDTPSSSSERRGGYGAVEIGAGDELDSIEVENLSDSQQESLRIAKKILSTLAVYPLLSPTMLQMGIGPATKPAIWRPVLEQLISEKFVVREVKPIRTLYGGLRQVVILRLRETSYTSPYEWQSEGFVESETDMPFRSREEGL